MPFEGFICEVSGEVVFPLHCLECARGGAPGCPMTAPVVKGILDGLRPDDFGLTVTSLLACARKERLKQERAASEAIGEASGDGRTDQLHHRVGGNQ